jgi:molecular chaperone DnaK
MAKITIGVDLGTTNTCAAIVKDGIAKFLELEPNSLTMPSAVRFVDGKADNVVVGRLAKKLAIIKPKEVFVSFKTLMQNDEWLNDPQIVESYKIDGKQFTPTDMAAKLLMHIFEVAQSSEFAAEGTINNIKICVPAASTPYYKKEKMVTLFTLRKKSTEKK